MGLDGVMIAGIICWFPQGGGCIVQYLYNENINIAYCVHLVRLMLITRRVIFFLLSKYSNYMRSNFTCCTGINCSANLWEGLRLPIVSWINSWWNLGLRDQMLDKVVMTRSRATDQMVLFICTYQGRSSHDERSTHGIETASKGTINYQDLFFKRMAQQSWNLDLILHVLSLQCSDCICSSWAKG